MTALEFVERTVFNMIRDLFVEMETVVPDSMHIEFSTSLIDAVNFDSFTFFLDVPMSFAKGDGMAHLIRITARYAGYGYEKGYYIAFEQLALYSKSGRAIEPYGRCTECGAVGIEDTLNCYGTPLYICANGHTYEKEKMCQN